MAVVMDKRPTGLDLKLARVARGVSQVEIARHLGVNRSRISALEGSIRPTNRAVTAYLAALDGAEP